MNRYFNPRPPQGERLENLPEIIAAIVFQSTPPARGATCQSCCRSCYWTISIHAPRKGSDPIVTSKQATNNNFNPRPPQGERLWKQNDKQSAKKFQSTPPARGATTSSGHVSINFCISIHAPRKGSDRTSQTSRTNHHYFNPRPPQGERHYCKFAQNGV